VGISTGAGKVFAEQGEEVLKAHDSGRDALVVGAPDKRFGARILAVLVAIAGRRLNPRTDPLPGSYPRVLAKC
jgi:fatty-acyl-CoA synthase